MLASARRRRTNPTQSILSAIHRSGSQRRLLDCRVCGAPNADGREGCFNCGSLLHLTEHALTSVTERLELGGDPPGRVVYVEL